MCKCEICANLTRMASSIIKLSEGSCWKECTHCHPPTLQLEVVKPQGKISFTVKNKDGTEATSIIRNKVVLTGRNAFAASLANQFNGEFPFYVTQILFGNNGTVGGSPRLVPDSQDALFGAAILTKPVIASIDPNLPQQVTFTSTIDFDEAVGFTIDEMALEMATGDLLSMSTFPIISKTSNIQLIFNWQIYFV